jgi:hypothetical protein
LVSSATTVATLLSLFLSMPSSKKARIGRHLSHWATLDIERSLLVRSFLQSKGRTRGRR